MQETYKMGRKGGEGLIKSVMVAYLVLVLHVLLILGLGLVVIFFSGIVHYMLWIFLVGAVAILTSFFYIYRRMKAEGRTLREMMLSPLFNGRPVEISLLGGLASFRIGGTAGGPHELGTGTHHPSHQLEDPGTIRLREIKELADLFKEDLITREEYENAKHHIFNLK